MYEYDFQCKCQYTYQQGAKYTVAVCRPCQLGVGTIRSTVVMACRVADEILPCYFVQVLSPDGKAVQYSVVIRCCQVSHLAS